MTITKELQGKIKALEMRCLRILLNITYRERITNIEVRSVVTRGIGPHYELLAMVITKKLTWSGHVIRSNTISKTLIQGTIDGKRRRGVPKCNGLQYRGLDRSWVGRSNVKNIKIEKDGRTLLIVKKSTAPLSHPRAMG